MPRNVRNFWIETDIDGANTMSGGPRSKDGGFSANIFIRSNGGVMKAVNISGHADGEHLLLAINSVDGQRIEMKTAR